MPNTRPQRSGNGAQKSAPGILKFGLGIGISVWLLAISLCPVVAYASENPQPHTAASDGSGFQPVDLSQVEKINGKSLTLIAYAIIFGVFVLYTTSILRREKAVEKEAQQLKKQLGTTP
jgi:hypothetical protein